MASSLSLRRLILLLPKPISSSLRPFSAAKFFNTNSASLRRDETDDDDTEIDSYRRFDSSLPRRCNDFSADVFAPFSASPVVNLADQIWDNPFLSTTRRGCYARETKESLHLCFDMPGLGKEDVKISVEKDTLLIKGEGGHVDGEEEPRRRRYNTGIQLPERMYKTDGVKAEMKNGVLKVVVPRIKEEERSDVFHVKIE